MRSVYDFDLDPESHDLVVGTWDIYYYNAEIYEHYLPVILISGGKDGEH